VSDDEKRDEDDKLEIIATILGEKLKIILATMGWSFDEAIVAADATGGLGTDEIHDRCMAGDPRAWLAVLRVSYMRAGREFPAEEIGKENMKALTDSFYAKIEEIMGGAEAPPTSPSGNGSSAPTEPSESEPVSESSAAPDSA
jgi:hypothetical protein